MSSSAIIIIASWEDRFLAGFQASKAAGGLRRCIFFASKRYQSRTEALRTKLIEEARKASVEVVMPVFDFGDAIQVHQNILEAIIALRRDNIQQVTFDISTAPRHFIWGILSELSCYFKIVTLRYTKAESYGDWQTDEDMAPRLVLNSSGIIYPDLPTCLVMMCGPEVARAEKMFYRFEPRRTIILRDSEASAYGAIKTFDKSDSSGVTEEPFDNKDFSDANVARLREIIGPYVGKYNILSSSFGPKLGAVVLFRLVQVHPEIALAYVPAGVHNPDLSRGIGEAQEFVLKLE